VSTGNLQSGHYDRFGARNSNPDVPAARSKILSPRDALSPNECITPKLGRGDLRVRGRWPLSGFSKKNGQFVCLVVAWPGLVWSKIACISDEPTATYIAPAPGACMQPPHSRMIAWQNVLTTWPQARRGATALANGRFYATCDTPGAQMTPQIGFFCRAGKWSRPLGSQPEVPWNFGAWAKLGHSSCLPSFQLAAGLPCWEKPFNVKIPRYCEASSACFLVPCKFNRDSL